MLYIEVLIPLNLKKLIQSVRNNMLMRILKRENRIVTKLNRFIIKRIKKYMIRVVL